MLRQVHAPGIRKLHTAGMGYKNRKTEGDCLYMTRIPLVVSLRAHGWHTENVPHLGGAREPAMRSAAQCSAVSSANRCVSEYVPIIVPPKGFRGHVGELMGPAWYAAGIRCVGDMSVSGQLYFSGASDKNDVNDRSYIYVCNCQCQFGVPVLLF